MGDGEDGGGDEPGQTHHGADAQHDGHHQQVEVIATAFLWDAQGQESVRRIPSHNESTGHNSHKKREQSEYAIVFNKTFTYRRSSDAFDESPVDLIAFYFQFHKAI